MSGEGFEQSEARLQSGVEFGKQSLTKGLAKWHQPAAQVVVGGVVLIRFNDVNIVSGIGGFGGQGCWLGLVLKLLVEQPINLQFFSLF